MKRSFSREHLLKTFVIQNLCHLKKAAEKTEGKTRHWLERYHIVVSTLALDLKINFDQPIKWMEFQKLMR